MIIRVNFNRTPDYEGFDLDIDCVRLKNFLYKQAGVNILFIDDSNNQIGDELAVYFKRYPENNDDIIIVNIESIIKQIRDEKTIKIDSKYSTFTSVPSVTECCYLVDEYLNKYFANRRVILVGDPMRHGYDFYTSYTYIRFVLSKIKMHKNYAILLINDVPTESGPWRLIKKVWNWLTRSKMERIVRDKMDECLNDDICRMHEEYEIELRAKRRRGNGRSGSNINTDYKY